MVYQMGQKQRYRSNAFFFTVRTVKFSVRTVFFTVRTVKISVRTLNLPFERYFYRSNAIFYLSYILIKSKNMFLEKSNRKAMNRNWSNHKANPALKTKVGNK